MKMLPHLINRHLIIPFGALCFLAGNSGAQVVPRMTLQLVEEIPLVGQPSGNTMNPSRCDSEGSIYFRRYLPRAFQAPILKFSADGKQKTVFSTETAKDWEGADIMDYAVARGGRVHVLAARAIRKLRKLEFAILTFDEKGVLSETTPIDMPLSSVDRVAAFPTGEFLISGYRKIEGPSDTDGKPIAVGTKDKRPEVEPVTAILDRNGALIAEASLALPSGNDASLVTAEVKSLPPGAIEGGSIASAEDGNLYILFRTSTPTLFVITPNGILARVLKVAPPSDKSEAMQLSTASGVGLMIRFGEREGEARFTIEKTVFSLINPQTGERLYDFAANRQLGASLACYTPSGMVFLGVSKGQLAILRAQPR